MKENYDFHKLKSIMSAFLLTVACIEYGMMVNENFKTVLDTRHLHI